MTIEEKKADKEAESVWAKFAYTASDGKTYQVDYYNLDVTEVSQVNKYQLACL